MYQPLADRIRPNSISEICGQSHLFGENGILKRLITAGKIPNMIFYGPSGCGKTTVAHIIASETKKQIFVLNATTATTSDIRKIVEQADSFLSPDGVLLYLDEIQYFSKKQQQCLLEFLENGSVTLIASTTENPYFYVYGAILSRCNVFEFKELSAEDMIPGLNRAVRYLEDDIGAKLNFEEGVLFHLSHACGGDMRKALNALEAMMFAATIADDSVVMTLADAKAVTQKNNILFDKDGDNHYDLLSAFQKSIRGSDPDASIYYLARLLEGGDLQSPIRRLLVIAAEDVGLAWPQAIAIVKACTDSALQLGLPEGRIPLSEATLLLATAPKSNSAVVAIDHAIKDIHEGVSGPIPAHLRDSHYSGATQLNRGVEYLYPHTFPQHWVKQDYLPNSLTNRVYYEFGDNKIEQAAENYWKLIKGNKIEHSKR